MLHRSLKSHQFMYQDGWEARLFLLIAPFLFAAYALLTPPFQTPDEQQHLFRAWQLSEGHLIGERRGNTAGGVLPESLGRAARPELGTLQPHALRRIVRRPFARNFGSGTAIKSANPERFYNFLGAVIYSPFGYVPQIASIFIGKSMGLSVENVIRLGRLMNASETILLIYFALRITPVGSLAFLWVGLLPMTGFASSTFGQDGLIIGSASLLTSLGLRKLFADQWTRAELVLSGILAVVISVGKFVYLPLALIGGVPFVERKIEWRKIAGPIIISLIAGVLAIAWLRAVSAVTLPAGGDLPKPSERLAMWARRPSELFLQFGQTYVVHFREWFMTLFTFGWLNIWGGKVVEYTALLSGVIVVLAGDPAAKTLDWRSRVWLLSVVIAIVLLLSFALLFSFTPRHAAYIAGLQGRYFIPIAPVLLVMLLQGRSLPIIYKWSVPLLMMIGNLFALRAIVTSYYN